MSMFFGKIIFSYFEKESLHHKILIIKYKCSLEIYMVGDKKPKLRKLACGRKSVRPPVFLYQFRIGQNF